jgi:phosphoribosylanthranilate isomerase
MKLKVCGLNNPENIIEVCKLKPDFIGFIFYEDSKRYVANNISDELIRNIPSNIKKVGVFVNEDIEVVQMQYHKYKLDYVQLHGNEDNQYCMRLFLKQIPIIKAFKVDNNFNFRMLEKFAPFCNLFLFDTKGLLPGGNGLKFNWEILSDYEFRIPFLLSGGVSLDDIDSIKSVNNEMIYGIDINSKFELKPGIKDTHKIKIFKNNLTELKQVNYENSNR